MIPDLLASLVCLNQTHGPLQICCIQCGSFSARINKWSHLKTYSELEICVARISNLRTTCALQAFLLEICSKVWPLNVAAGASPSAERHFFYSPTCSGIGGWISQVLLGLASFDYAANSPQFLYRWQEIFAGIQRGPNIAWRIVKMMMTPGVAGRDPQKAALYKWLEPSTLLQQKGDKGVQRWGQVILFRAFS